MGFKKREQSGVFANILSSDGTIRVNSKEGESGAELREGILQDGTPFKKWEHVYSEFSGIIKMVDIEDGKFGERVKVTMESGEETVFICMPFLSNFAEDFLKKLPSVDLMLEVTIKPYAFTDKEGRTKKGITLNQGINKIENFFTEYNPETKKTEYKHDFPKPDQSKGQFNKNQWKIYFAQCREFLREFTTNNIVPTFQTIDFTLSDDNTPVETKEIENVEFAE